VVKTSQAPDDIQSSFEYPLLDVAKGIEDILKPEGTVEEVNDADVPAEETEEDRLAAEYQRKLDEMMKQAEKVLEDARNVAEQIKQEAYDEGFAAGQKSGYDKGFQEGVSQGLIDYQKKITELEDMFAASIVDVDRIKEKTLEKYMDDLKEISLSIGEKIVRTSLRSNVRVIERMILAATEKLKKSAWAKIYIGATQEMGKDINADPRFLQELSNISDSVKIIIMEDVETGTCIVERPDEIIDMSVGTQLENIREIMNNARL
jgi:Flagellar biosynthesis/type III secretory pathway protein